MLPGSSDDKEELEKCNTACWRAKLSYMNLRFMGFVGRKVQGYKTKCRGRNVATWTVTLFPHPDLFWAQHRQLGTPELPVLMCICTLSLPGTCTGFVPIMGHAVMVIVPTASCRIICASQQPRFHMGHPLHSHNHNCSQ